MTLGECIDAIEASYELMLAYAAQGRDFESQGADGPPIRGALEQLKDGLARIADLFEARIAAAGPRVAFSRFCAVLEEDAARALLGVELVLSLGNITSQLVDNLNASLHLRALLTDLFLLDEACRTLAR